MKEKKCPVTRLPIIHKPEWDVFHSGPDYRVVFETIGTDIIHARVSAERGTYLDFIDKELFRLVCDELKVEEKKVYVVIDYDPIREVRLSYKQDYANLFYNWGPWIALLVVYNVHPDIRTDMESLGALCPLKSQAMIVDSYDDAMKSVLEAQELFGQYAVPGVVAVNSEEDLKNRFLAAVARLSWLDLVDHPIDFPPAGSGREGYFQALDALRMDLLEGEELHEQKIAAIKKSMLRAKRSMACRSTCFLRSLAKSVGILKLREVRVRIFLPLKRRSLLEWLISMTTQSIRFHRFAIILARPTLTRSCRRYWLGFARIFQTGSRNAGCLAAN